MIKSFKSRETEKLFNREFSRRLPLEIQRTTMRKLTLIDVANNINDLRIIPSNHLELLKGDKEKRFSIRINKQWRICFIWQNGDAYEVEITDYH